MLSQNNELKSTTSTLSVKNPELLAILERIKSKPRVVKVIEIKKEPADGIFCDRCDSTGWVLREDGMSPCPDCYEKRMAVRRLKNSGVNPDDYKKYSLDKFDGTRNETAKWMKDTAVQWLKQHKPNGVGFGVFGQSGMGKTHICIGLCLKLTEELHEPHYYFSYRAEMPNLFKAARGFKEDYEAAMEKWKTCRNLYIDDLFKLAGHVENGKVVGVDRDELRIVFDLINARCLNHLTTLFSSELTLEDIIEIDQATGSRIFEMCKGFCVNVKGENQRMKE